jgi:hypothetical protein
VWIGASPAVYIHRVVHQGHADLDSLSKTFCADSR